MRPTGRPLPPMPLEVPNQPGSRILSVNPFQDVEGCVQCIPTALLNDVSEHNNHSQHLSLFQPMTAGFLMIEALGTKYRLTRFDGVSRQLDAVLAELGDYVMNRLLIVFIRQRMAGRIDVDLGELFDAAEQYLKVKLEARAFFAAVQVALRDRRDHRKSRFAANA